VPDGLGDDRGDAGHQPPAGDGLGVALAGRQRLAEPPARQRQQERPRRRSRDRPAAQPGGQPRRVEVLDRRGEMTVPDERIKVFDGRQPVALEGLSVDAFRPLGLAAEELGQFGLGHAAPPLHAPRTCVWGNSRS
jgi:hypothetical protein